MSANFGRGRPSWARSGNADSGANRRGQTNQRAFQRPQGINRGSSGGGSHENHQRDTGGTSNGGHHRNAGASLPISRHHLSAIVSREDADQLLITLSTKPGWLRLLESDFQSSEFGVIFAALKKCSEASSLDLLRRFMRKSLSSDNFESRCCLMLGALGQGDLRIVEDVVAVLEASAWLQPAGLAKTCMILLASLEGNRAMSSWDMASKLDLSEKLRTTREQFLEAAKASNASRVATQSAPKIFKGYRTSGTASNSFRDMSILPTKEDLEEEHPFLRPNIVAGAYESLEDYLDVQFRLLREDYVTPLRDGLREFKGMGSEFVRWKLRSIQDVRFYTGVSYQRPQESNSVLAIKERIVLLLAPDDFKHVNWARSKRFTNGALIGITKDKFETIIFATVSNRDPDALRQNGALTLELCFDEEILEFKPDIEFSLIESSGAYFEAYRHNLAVLQSMTEMPFSQNLVFAKKDVQRPSFLTTLDPRRSCIDVKPIMKESENYKFDLDNRWPLQEDTILNVRQFDAIKSAFNNELCVIQGPPGTGKTFVGLKIVELMLLNGLTERPFLIVCYTNHALDQFVEGISKFTEDIVRLGGRCGSEELEKFTLRALRRRTQGRMTQDERYKLENLIWDLRGERRIRTMTLERIEYYLAALQGRTIFTDCDWFGPNLDKILRLDCIDRIVMQAQEEVDEDALEDDGNLSDEDRGEVEDEDIVVQTKCNTRKEAAIKKLLGSYKQPNDRSLPYTKYKFDKNSSLQ